MASEFPQLLARSMFCYISVANVVEETGGFYILYAFIAFAVAEPVRYPYYLLKLIGYEETALGRFYGHLRYNLFIVFYPIGAFCDLMTGVHSAPNVAHLNYLMPNTLNIAFNYQFAISVVTPIIYAIMLPFNYKYLLAQRSKYYAQRAEKLKVKAD